MTPLIENVWNLLDAEYNMYNQENPNFKFDKTQKNDFKQIFSEKYDYVMKNYMDSSVKDLDRHKVAALIIVSLLEIDAIYYENLDEDCVFIGAELLALKVGLAYMVEKLNEKLCLRGIKKKIEKFNFPNAQSCDTSYIDIMCRNLYYAKTDYKLNPLDLADRLFLVEYIALSKEGIDPDVLKDY